MRLDWLSDSKAMDWHSPLTDGNAASVNRRIEAIASVGDSAKKAAQNISDFLAAEPRFLPLSARAFRVGAQSRCTA